MGAFTLPGQTVIPKGYGEAVVLYSESGCSAVVDGAPPGPNGRNYIIPAKKPTKVPFEVGRHLLNNDQFPYLDVVKVDELETEAGVSYDVAKAKSESMERGKQSDELAFKRYISDAVTDYVKNNKPVPQPPDNILRIIERRGYDLKRFGITPIGWENPDKDKRVADLEAQVARLIEQLGGDDGKKAKK